MVLVRVLRRFKDFKVHDYREPGDVFEVTEGRAAQIAAALPGYVSIEAAAEPEQPKEQVDLSKLTVTQLKGLCEERGIEVPKRAKKAELIALLD